MTADLADSFGLDRPHGALVSQVQPDSPAQKAGFQASDVILSFNGKPVENSGDLPRMVGMAKPGAKVQAEIWRKGKRQQIDVVLGELPAASQVSSKDGKTYSRGGLALTELSEEQRDALGIDHGLLVEDVTGDAARAGIRTGDVILAVNNSKVSTVAGLRKLMAAVPVGRTVAILVRRGEGSMYVPLKIASE